MWFLVVAIFAVGVLAVCAAHIPVLRDLTGAAPLEDDERAAAKRRHPAGRDLPGQQLGRAVDAGEWLADTPGQRDGGER